MEGAGCSFTFKKRNIKGKSTRKRQQSSSEEGKLYFLLTSFIEKHGLQLYNVMKK